MRRARALALLTVVLSVLVATLWTGAPRAEAYDGWCVLSGRIVNQATGEPVEGVEVHAYRLLVPENLWVWEMWAGTDSTGRFSFVVSGRERGEGALFLRGPGVITPVYYRDTPVTGPEPVPTAGLGINLSNTGDIASATHFNLRPDATVSFGDIPVTVTPNPYGTIIGKVTDARLGTPFQPTDIYVYKRDPMFGWRHIQSTCPREDGSYTVRGDAANPIVGEVRLYFDKSTLWANDMWFPNAGSMESARSLYIEPEMTLYGVDQTITVCGRLCGRVVRAETGAGLHPVSIDVYKYDPASGTWPQWAGGATKPGGVYAVPQYGFGPGTFRIEAIDIRLGVPHLPTVYYRQVPNPWSATAVSLPSGGIVDGLDVVMSAVPAVVGKVSGTDGAPLADVRVEVSRRGSDGIWRVAGSDYSDGSGWFYFMCGSAGTYRARYIDEGGTDDPADDSFVFSGGAATAATSTAVVVSAGAARLPDVELAPAAEPRARRISGSNRYDTAIAASREAFPDGTATSVVLVSGESFADALSAAGVAGALDAPVLLTTASKLYLPLLNEFDRLGVTKVYLLGGTGAIPRRVETLLQALGYTTERIAGSDRYETSALAARAVSDLSETTSETPVLVTRGDVPADALSVAPAAVAADGVVLLVRPASAPTCVVDAIGDLGLSSGYVVGGSGAVTDATLEALGAAGMDIERIAGGATRYETAAQFAEAAVENGWLDFTEVGLAIGTGFADALGSGASLGQKGGVLLLTSTSALPAATSACLAEHSSDTDAITVYGGGAAIKSEVMVQAGSL
ncbi:MAG: hypothetical protein FDZ70_09150 [Actinobacteria bacterium]|nr:MAG: hypothetical protein FDZ70_09150 [Actinomycetota bacterium]